MYEGEVGEKSRHLDNEYRGNRGRNNVPTTTATTTASAVTTTITTSTSLIYSGCIGVYYLVFEMGPW